MPMRDFVAPQFRSQFDAYLREIERTGESRGLLAVVTRSGEQRIWEYHNTLRTEGVAAPIVRGIAHDVTEQVRAEKALRASNEQLLKTARERRGRLRRAQRDDASRMRKASRRRQLRRTSELRRHGAFASMVTPQRELDKNKNDEKWFWGAGTIDW